MIEVRDLLPLHALGLLDAADCEAVERAVAADPALAAELVAYRDAASALVRTLPAVEPPAPVWDRIVHSIGAGRFERFVTRFQHLFDVTAERAREVLGWVDDPSRWEAFKPGSWLIHFEAGPACAGADNGLVKVSAGAPFPWHGHDGEETALVLQGSGRDHKGNVLHAGDVWVEHAGTQHEFHAGEGEDLVFAVRVYGVDFDVTRPE